MIERLEKTEINHKTLELIKIHKTKLNNKEQIKQMPEFSFSLVLSADKTSQSTFKINMIVDDYDVLKQWIVGLNCLIINRDQVSRLS